LRLARTARAHFRRCARVRARAAVVVIGLQIERGTPRGVAVVRRAIAAGRRVVPAVDHAGRCTRAERDERRAPAEKENGPPHRSKIAQASAKTM
jgi:hypothetical protein